MSSRELRSQIVELLKQSSYNNPDEYSIYITAAVVGWHFRDVPGGLSTLDQVKVYHFVHLYVAALHKDYPTEEIGMAHDFMHELGEELIEKLKAKGIISADDDGFTDDDSLLEKHEGDFFEWSKELKVSGEEGK